MRSVRGSVREQFAQTACMLQRGAVEQAVAAHLEHEVGAVSEVYFGGAWKGNACRKYLGLVETKEVREGKAPLKACFLDTAKCPQRPTGWRASGKKQGSE